MALPNEKFMNKLFVDKNIKQLVEEDLLWEKYIKPQGVDALSVLYYKEQYMDVETPNDAAFTSKTLDPFGGKPGFRSEGSLFPHVSIGEPKEFNLRLYQLALEIDYTEEEMKFVTMENRVLKKQEKLANYFGSCVNGILGDAITESWSTTPTGINHLDIAGGKEWSTATADPVADILDCEEKISDIPGFNYKPNIMMVPKASYFDLAKYVIKNDYAYGFETINGVKKLTSLLGYGLIVSNMVKRDMAVLADLKSAGTLFQAEPFETEVYKTQEDRCYHIQATRRFNFALTDPLAVCTIVNTHA